MSITPLETDLSAENAISALPDAANHSQVDALRDQSRLTALRQSGLLDSPAEEIFDRFTRLASKILNVPVSLVSFVDAEHQFFKSALGLGEPWASERQTPLSYSFCRHVVERRAPLLVEDARQDPLVRDSPAISELGVVAYAGMPLITNDGHALGSLCVIDQKPHSWTEQELSTLRDLAALAVTEIELRRATREADNQAQEARRISEQAERERKEKQALLDSAGEGIYGIDQEGRCTFLSRAAAGMLRYEQEEVLGRNMHELIHHSHRDGAPYREAECPIARAIQRGEGCRIDDEVFWRSNGSALPVEYASSPIIENGIIQGAVVTFADITRRKHLEQLRDDLMHMIVHDLRTPLTSLLMGLETVRLIDNLQGAQVEMLELATHGAKTLLGMINDLLDVNKMEAGAIALDLKEVSASDLIDTALLQVELLARSKHLSLTQEVDETLPYFKADEEKLRRVLVNLLGNALKFTFRGGVRVGAKLVDGDKAIAFYVRDTGEGIPETEFDRIFEKFGQVETRQRGRKMSTGLGLTFCKMAVEAHGGHIWIESELGQGSTFWFTIPLQIAPVASLDLPGYTKS